MKKGILFSIIAMIGLASCQQKEDFTLPIDGEKMTFYASIADDATKTTAEVDGEKTKVLWTKDDAYSLSVKGGAFAKFTLDGEGGQTTGTFSGTALEGEGTQNIAYYPYTEGITLTDGKLSVVFPSVQAYSANSIAAAPMVAVSADNTLKFQNVSSLIKITIKGEEIIKSVSLTGNNDESLAGNALVTLEETPSLALAADAEGKTITLDCGEGIQLTTDGVDFYFAVPSITLTKGFTVVAIDSEEKAMIKSTTKEVVLTASKVKVFPAFEYENNLTEVSTLDEINEAISNSKNIKLLNDITLSAILVINEDIIFDGNGYTLTSTAGRAINVSGAADVTIKNLTINASGERAINIIQNAKKVTIDNVTATAANYTVNVASSAPGAVVVINNSTLTGLNAVNIGASYADVTIEESSITTVDNNENEGYSTIALNKDAEYAKVIVTNSTINITGSAATDSRKASIGAEGCYISINGSTDVAESHVACIEYGNYYYGFTEIGHALNKAVAGETIKLLRDVTITEKITIDKSITLDGGNHSITSNVQSDPLNHRAINVIGVNEVTIKNLTIETNGERAINIIGGTKKVILDNVTATSSHYTVNIAGSAPNSNLTITNSELTGLNVVNSGAEGSDIKIENTVLTVVDDSDVEGYGAVHLDKPNSKVAVNGCTINIKGPHTNGSYGFVVMAGNLVECTNTSGNTTIKGCYAIIEYPGSNYFYSFGSLEEAIAKAESGETVKLIADITIDQTINIEKNVTIDLNGKKLTANAQGARAFKVNADNVNFTLDATGSNVEFGNSTYGIVEIANDVDNAKVTIEGGTFVGTTDDGCLIRYRSGNNNEVEINNVNYTDNCPVSGQDNTNAYVIGTNGVGEGNKLTVQGGTYAATGIIADYKLSKVLFDGVTVNAKGIGFELKNGEIRNSNITLDPGAYVYSVDCVPILASNSGKIIVSNTTITSPTTETLSGYGLVVAPTGGEIEATNITINAAEGKKYYIYQMYEGKVGKISVNGEIVAQSNN